MTNTTSENLIGDNEIRDVAIGFHVSDYKSGVFPELSCMDSSPSNEDFSARVNNNLFKRLDRCYLAFVPNIVGKKKWDSELLEVLKELDTLLGRDALAKYIVMRYYRDGTDKFNLRCDSVKELLTLMDSNSSDIDFSVFDKKINLQIRGR